MIMHSVVPSSKEGVFEQSITPTRHAAPFLYTLYKNNTALLAATLWVDLIHTWL